MLLAGAGLASALLAGQAGARDHRPADVSEHQDDRIREGDRERGRLKPCVAHRLQTPYRGYGYDHEVVLENSCDHAERCRIESPSASAPTVVVVAAKGKQVIVLRRGSPAREFTAQVTCKPK